MISEAVPALLTLSGWQRGGAAEAEARRLWGQVGPPGMRQALGRDR